MRTSRFVRNGANYYASSKMPAVLLPVLATVAGVVSFTSPCCLPLVPGYLSYMSALPVADLGQRQARAVALRASVLFVAGFTVVFSAVDVALLRVGLLPTAIAIYTSGLFLMFPMTTDLDAWYAGAGVSAMLVFAALTIFGFVTSLGGHSPFGRAAAAR